jgi:hypothetical protein
MQGSNIFSVGRRRRRWRRFLVARKAAVSDPCKLGVRGEGGGEGST